MGLRGGRATAAAEDGDRAATALVERLADGVVVVADADDTVLYANRAAARLLGRPVEEIVGLPFPSSLAPGRLELRIRRPDRRSITLEAAVEATAWEGRAASLATLRDVTDRVVTETRLVRQSMHDPLTGLPNRALFRDRLERAVAQRRRRRGYRFAVLVLDVERFRWVNDSLGHTAGDDVLREVARRLSSCVRPGDTVARLGGDEFAVLLEALADSDDAHVVASRVLESFDAPLSVRDRDVLLSLAVGLVGSEMSDGDADDVLHDADAALTEAKQAGGDRLAVFEPATTPRSAHLELEQDLRRAVEGGDGLVVHYQPIVVAADRRLLGFEALVRWQHPERGFLLPSEFLDVAEETGLVVPLGERVLEAVARQLADWNRAGVGDAVSVSVNVSARQLARGDLVERVSTLLDAHGLAPRQLCLEITERVVMADTIGAQDLLADLRALGVRIFTDDFGSGYSGLGYLSRFPVDAVKIDRSFVAQIDRRPGDAAIVEAIVGLCRALDVHVVAEGVETEEQLAVVRRLGCDSAQGFLFSGPIAEAEVIDLAAIERRVAPT